MQNKKETNELYKEGKVKREVKISAAVFADDRALVAFKQLLKKLPSSRYF